MMSTSALTTSKRRLKPHRHCNFLYDEMAIQFRRHIRESGYTGIAPCRGLSPERFTGARNGNLITQVLHLHALRVSAP